MAKIRKIYDETIKPDGNKTVIYPITSTRAVYTPTNVTLDNILNEGYRFGGVVSPSSVPTIYDQRVFYGAGEPGVYSAFGGIIVETGEAAFLMYDGSIWTKKLFSKTGSNITGFKVVDSISDLPTTPSTLGYLIPDTNSVQTLYVWVGEGGDTYSGMYNNCGRLNGESAYETAVRKGYQGTEEEWLLSLNGQDGRGIVSVSYQLDAETRNTIVTFLFSDGTTSSFPLQDGLSKAQIDANTEAIAVADSNIETLSTATSANTTSIVGLSKLASINVILDPTQSFASQVTEPSVVYEIRDDFDLGGAEITLPDDCVLLFNGGKIANGTVNAANATYQVMGLYQIFDGIEFGNNFFKCCDIIPEYVGAVGDGVADDTEAMRESLKISSLGRTTLIIPSGRGYLVSGPINYYNGGFANSFINIKGFLPDMKTTDTDINSILNYGRIIVADGACLFGDASRTTLSTLRGAISNVAILGTRNLDTNFFKWCNVVSFCMKYCFVCNFGAFLCDSSVKTNSRIHDNHFASVFYFSRLVNRDLISLIDSAIFNNYINGGANPKEIVSVNACFQFGEYNGSVIRDNFIDFYRTIYEPIRTSNNGPAGHINAFGNHYQVFRYFYFMGSGITSMYMNSQHEYFNWNDEAVIGSPDGPLGNNYMPFVSRTYTGRDGNTYDLPPYIMRTSGGAQNIVIEDITVEKNMDKLIMFHGAPTSYKYNRYKFTVANWTDDFGTKYSLPEGSDEGNYCGGSFQYKEVETNFICTLSELPTLKVGTYSAFPYGAKALYNGTIYKAKRFYTTAAVARWVPYNDVSFFPDYEDFTANSNMQLKLRDRDASNGMGYKILRTDKTFAAQVTSTNTVYEIRYNFDLDSSTVVLPENAVLKFVGGKISNGTLNGNKTKIDAGKYDTIFDSVILSGSFDCDYLTPVQFGAVMDSTASADTNSSIISNYVKPSCEGTSTPLYIPVGSLYFSSPIVLSGNVDITCKGTLVYNGTASTVVALTIGTSQNQYNRNYVIKLSNANDSNSYYSQVSDEWQIQDVTGLLMKNIHSSRIHLEYIKGFPYNVVLSGENAPFAYNTIYCGYNTGYTYINMKLICSGSGYSNENLFIGGRFGITSTCSVRDISKAIVLDGDTNVINNNVFIKPCIEGHNIGFEFKDATRNTILASRNENNTYNNAFLSNSRENVVLSGYYEGATLNESNGSNLSSSFAALLNSYMATVANDPVIVYGNNSNLIQLLNNRTISGNAARSLYGRGYVIDVSTFKTWRISQDVSSRFAIVPLNVDNSPITVSNVSDFITNTSGWLIQNSYIRSSADAYSRMVTFSSNTSKVFIGTTATTDANRLRLETMYNPYTTVSSLIPFPELAKWPYDVKSVNSIPSTQRNVPTGYSIYYAPGNKFITWDGSSWSNDATNNLILSPEQSVSSQMTSVNTSYEVRDSFDLEGATVNVPAGCKIIFNGGKFSNGVISGTDLTIETNHDQVFDNVTLSGVLNDKEIYSGWFVSIDDFITSVNNTSGYILARFAKGTFYPTRAISVDNRDSFEVDGGHATLIYNTQMHAFRVNVSADTSGWASETLSGTYSAGAETVANTLGLNKGDIILLQDTASYSFSPYRNYRQGEFCEMDTATTLKHPIYGNYVNSGSIVAYKPVLTKFKVKDLDIQYNISDTIAHSSLINGLYLKYCRNAIIENVNILNFDIGINIASSFGVEINGSSTISATNPVSDLYGILVSNSQDVKVSRCNCRGGNHGISIGGVYSGIGAIINRNIIVEDCVCTDFRSNYVGGIETHGNCEYFYVLNNITTGVGLAGNHCKVSGNYLKKCGGTQAFGVTILEMTGYDHEITNNFIEGEIYIDKYYAAGAYQDFNDSTNYSINDDYETLRIANNIWKYNSADMNATRNTGPFYLMATSSIAAAITALKKKAVILENNTVDVVGAYINTVTTYADVIYRNNRFNNFRVSLTNSGNFTFSNNYVYNSVSTRMFDIGYSANTARVVNVENNYLYHDSASAIRWFNLSSDTTLTSYIVKGNSFMYSPRTSAVNVYFVERNSTSSKSWNISDNKFQYDATASTCRINITADEVIYDKNRIVNANGSLVTSNIVLQISATTFINHSRLSGNTANRPVTTEIGQQYYDTSLSKPVWYAGASVWVDATGTAV